MARTASEKDALATALIRKAIQAFAFIPSKTFGRGGLALDHPLLVLHDESYQIEATLPCSLSTQLA